MPGQKELAVLAEIVRWKDISSYATVRRREWRPNDQKKLHFVL